MNIKTVRTTGLLCILGLFAKCPNALAANTGLPWENPLATLRNSISGPTALAIAIIAIVVAGGMLIFGGELNEFARRSIMLVLFLSLLVASNATLTTFFGVAAAVVM